MILPVETDGYGQELHTSAHRFGVFFHYPPWRKAMLCGSIYSY
jgi:hypothetical protein